MAFIVTGLGFFALAIAMSLTRITVSFIRMLRFRKLEKEVDAVFAKATGEALEPVPVPVVVTDGREPVVIS